jgi:hypothetical protein
MLSRRKALPKADPIPICEILYSSFVLIIPYGEKGTGNREQGIGNREQGTGNREKGTGNREQGTGNREQGIGNRE